VSQRIDPGATTNCFSIAYIVIIRKRMVYFELKFRNTMQILQFSAFFLVFLSKIENSDFLLLRLLLILTTPLTAQMTVANLLFCESFRFLLSSILQKISVNWVQKLGEYMKNINFSSSPSYWLIRDTKFSSANGLKVQIQNFQIAIIFFFIAKKNRFIQKKLLFRWIHGYDWHIFLSFISKRV
jgi:hypothetical protein